MPRGAKPAEYPKELYSFRLNGAPDTAREKKAFDEWIEAELKNMPRPERARAIEGLVLGLIRHYLNITPPEHSPAPQMAVNVDLEGILATLRAEMKVWLAGVVQDPERFAMLEQVRDEAELSGDDFDDSTLDNFLEDFHGARQSGDS